MKYVLSTIFALIIGLAGATAETTSQLADSAYNKENYTEAIELYNKVLAENGRSSDVYYNLGNAWFRKGNTAQAILAYERALRIDPTNADARTNLDFVNSRLEDKPENNNSLIARVHQSIMTAVSANAWAWIALSTFLLLCGAIALYIFSGNIALRKLGFFGGIVLLVLSFYFVIVAAGAARRVNDHKEAIVTAPSTMLNSQPRMPKQTETVVPLHEGTKVEIVDSVDTPDDPESPMWYNVRINGSMAAWLRAIDVERI